MLERKSPFDGMRATRFSSLLPILLFIGLELAMWTMFFAVYSETVGLMDETYLSELPIIGIAFSYIDPDANASHIISMLLATFSVGTPIFIWREVHHQNILDDPREWFCHPQNQIIAGFAAMIMLLVIGLEVTNLYTLVARESMSSGVFVQAQESNVMAFLAQNKGLAIAVSVVIAVINIVLALFTTRAIHTLTSSKED